ncbi:unnamed protein product, partial [Closterium sp. NIES-53]
YHAGLSTAARTEALDDWSRGKIPLMIATVAFGMVSWSHALCPALHHQRQPTARKRLDCHVSKFCSNWSAFEQTAPDCGIDRGIVRLVCHYALPKSIEALYQESGRAGRDQQPWSEAPYTLSLSHSLPSLQGIDRGIVRLVCHYSLPKSIEAFYQESGRAGRDQQPCRSILYYGVQDRRTMEFIIKKDNGARGKGPPQPQRVKNALDAFQKMVDYCELLSCRRMKLLTHFGETATPRLCAGGCDVCKTPHSVKAALQELRESGAVGGSGGGMQPRVQMGRV